MLSVTLQMDGNYPDISSGVVSFENVRTDTKISLVIPNDLESEIYGIRSITMDPGASYTIFPAKFAKLLNIERPSEHEKAYYIFRGVGGTSICFYSPDLVNISIEDDRNRLERNIFPFFLTNYAPSFTCEGRLLSAWQYQPYTEKVLPFISPPLRYQSNYRVEVHSPKEKSPFQNRRLKLEVDTGEEMDYILIGRDWQRGFDCVFKTDKIMISKMKHHT